MLRLYCTYIQHGQTRKYTKRRISPLTHSPINYEHINPTHHLWRWSSTHLLHLMQTERVWCDLDLMWTQTERVWCDEACLLVLVTVWDLSHYWLSLNEQKKRLKVAMGCCEIRLQKWHLLCKYRLLYISQQFNYLHMLLFFFLFLCCLIQHCGLHSFNTELTHVQHINRHETYITNRAVLLRAVIELM